MFLMFSLSVSISKRTFASDNLTCLNTKSLVFVIVIVTSKVDEYIPFTILAFFPEFKMRDFHTPTLSEMIDAYLAIKAVGLKNVRLGNTGVFAKSEEDYKMLEERVGQSNY